MFDIFLESTNAYKVRLIKPYKYWRIEYSFSWGLFWDTVKDIESNNYILFNTLKEAKEFVYKKLLTNKKNLVEYNKQVKLGRKINLW